jgi:hypothetical protein
VEKRKNVSRLGKQKWANVETLAKISSVKPTNFVPKDTREWLIEINDSPLIQSLFTYLRDNTKQCPAKDTFLEFKTHGALAIKQISLTGSVSTKENQLFELERMLKVQAISQNTQNSSNFDMMSDKTGAYTKVTLKLTSKKRTIPYLLLGGSSVSESLCFSPRIGAGQQFFSLGFVFTTYRKKAETIF